MCMLGSSSTPDSSPHPPTDAILTPFKPIHAILTLIAAREEAEGRHPGPMDGASGEVILACFSCRALGGAGSQGGISQCLLLFGTRQGWKFIHNALDL